MDFKTKRKIVIMKRKFTHTDLAMISGALAMIGTIVFNIVNDGNLF